MKWLLLIIFLSSGVYEEKHISAESCIDAIHEANIVKGKDVWSASCFGPDDQVIATAVEDIGP